ncbi:hypothetical protein TNCV_4946411 [Trichonephila clavipes]|nr:hypothetical protein TNCV_4946411 [Trichonephila clavipes]
MGKVWHVIPFASEWNSTRVEPHRVRFTLGSRCGAHRERFRAFGAQFFVGRCHFCYRLFQYPEFTLRWGEGSGLFQVRRAKPGRGGRDVIFAARGFGYFK